MGGGGGDDEPCLSSSGVLQVSLKNKFKSKFHRTMSDAALSAEDTVFISIVEILSQSDPLYLLMYCHY